MLDRILEYHPATDMVQTVGHMSVGRAKHSVSILDNIEEICPTSQCDGKGSKLKTKLARFFSIHRQL